MKNSFGLINELVIKAGVSKVFGYERRGFKDFISELLRIPNSVDHEDHPIEPFRSIALMVILGQRPITSILVLEVLKENEHQPLLGKEVAKKVAEKLEIPEKYLAEGGYYKDRIGDLLNAFVDLGLIQKSKIEATGREGYHLRPYTEASTLLSNLKSGNNIFSCRIPKDFDLVEVLKTKFDKKVGYLRRYDGQELPFEVEKIIESLIDKSVGVSLIKALEILSEIEKDLHPGMAVSDLQRKIYDSIKEQDPQVASRYLKRFPLPIKIQTKTGKIIPLSFSVMRMMLVDQLGDLRITSRQQEAIERELWMRISKEGEEFAVNEENIKNLMDIEIKKKFLLVDSRFEFLDYSLDSARKSMQKTLDHMRSRQLVLSIVELTRFMESITACVLVLCRYLPYKDHEKNFSLLFNLLHQKNARPLFANIGMSNDDIMKLNALKFVLSQQIPTLNRVSQQVELLEPILPLLEKIVRKHRNR